jgi:hypothetical protein
VEAEEGLIRDAERITKTIRPYVGDGESNINNNTVNGIHVTPI